MINADAIEFWRERKDRALDNISNARLILYTLLVLISINVVLNIYSMPLIFILYLAVYFPIIVFIRSDLSRDYERLMSDEFSRKISLDTFNSGFKDMIVDILGKFNIESRIEYYVTTNNFDYSPHVFAKDRINFLVLPLGFFKLLSEKPDQAKAILAHEISHIAQEDTGLTFMIKVLLKYIFSIILPLQLVIMSPILYYSFIDSREERMEAENARMAIFGTGDVQYQMGRMQEHLESARFNERIFWILASTMVILALVYIYFRRIAYRSEMTADIGGAVMTSKGAIKDAIERVLTDVKYKKKRVFWFTVNPSIEWRLNKLERMKI